jgi:hypothetical protein
MLTINTTPINTALKTSGALQRSLGWFAFALPLGFVMVPTKKRKLMWLGLLIVVFAVMVQAGCAGGGQHLTGAQSSNTSTPNPGSSAGSNSSGTSGTSSGTSTGTSSGTSTGASGSSTNPAPDPPLVPASGPTPAGTYQVTVTATSGSITQSQVITLVVQ